MSFRKPLGQLVLEAMGNDPIEMIEIYKAVPGKRSSIDKARQRLQQAGKIEKVSPGVYCKKEVLISGAGDEISVKPEESPEEYWELIQSHQKFEEMSESDQEDYFYYLVGQIHIFACKLIDSSKIGENANIAHRFKTLAEVLEISHMGFPDHLFPDLKKHKGWDDAKIGSAVSPAELPAELSLKDVLDETYEEAWWQEESEK